MQHVPTIDAARRAFRAVICPVCPQRPHRSESLPATVERPCEPDCPLFLQVENLKEIAERPGHYEFQIRNRICNETCHRSTAGDYCGERLNGTCPLSCFAGQAVGILAGLVAAEQIARDRLMHVIEHKP